MAGRVVGGYYAAGNTGGIQQGLQIAGLFQAHAATEAACSVSADLDAVVGVVVFVQRQQQLYLTQHFGTRRVLAANQLQRGKLGRAQAAA
ncbi:hypothetical protein JOS77_12365 [Chromobacterium haemolyticum]|nr:hypothetical protein JOS77_12365 [Chromobacterium haemolyticum]